MVQVEIDDTRVLAALYRLIDAGTDVRPPLEDIGEYLVLSTRQRFQRGEAAGCYPIGSVKKVTDLFMKCRSVTFFTDCPFCLGLLPHRQHRYSTTGFRTTYVDIVLVNELGWVG